MKKSELNNSMIVQTTHNRYGFVETENNRINFCYDPDRIEQDYTPDLVSLDDVFELEDGSLVVGTLVTEENKKKYSDLFEYYEVGDIAIWYEIIAVFQVHEIYNNGEGPYPPLKLE